MKPKNFPNSILFKTVMKRKFNKKFQLEATLQFISQLRKIRRKLTKNYAQTKSTRSPGIAEVVHNALDASIYRLSNVGPHFNNCVVDPKNYGPNWMLCRNIKHSIPTEISVFVAGLYHSIQFSIATCSLSFVLDSVVTNFNNVTTEF